MERLSGEDRSGGIIGHRSAEAPIHLASVVAGSREASSPQPDERPDPEEDRAEERQRVDKRRPEDRVNDEVVVGQERSGQAGAAREAIRLRPPLEEGQRLGKDEAGDPTAPGVLGPARG